MSSQINSQNIDKTFPVAGQDNNSQGFRDNFDAIQRNFEFAKTELEDLQNKSLLKSPLGGSGTVSNDLGGSNISNGTYTNFHGTSYTQTVSTSANISILNGPLQAFTLTNDTAFTFTNWPASGNFGMVRAHFTSNGSIINVGNDVELGRRYTVDQVGTTNFTLMGASPTAIFTGSISGSELNVSSTSTPGKITVGTVISGPGVTPGTRIIASNAENPNLSGTGSGGTYTVDTSQSVVSGTSMTGMTSGVVFVAQNSRGSGSGTVKPWRRATLLTESTGVIIPDSDFVLNNSGQTILELNPDGANQVVEAWTWTGSSSRRVFVSYVGNLGESGSDLSSLSIGSLRLSDTVESTTIESGALVVSGGTGIARNLNVGGSVVIDGNLFVSGNTTLTTSSVTIQDIGDISNVVITTPIQGDSIKFDGVNWTNNVDLVEYEVYVDDMPGSDTQEVFFIDSVPITTAAGVQEAGLKFEIGKKYRFDLSDPSNASAPLRFSTTPDTAVPTSITPYTDNVIVGNSFVEILITSETPSPLFLYGLELEPSLDTSLIGGAYPIQVGNGPVLVVKDYTPTGSQAILVDTRFLGVYQSGDTIPVGYTIGDRKPLFINLPVNSSQRPLTPGTFITVTDNGNAETNNIIIKPQPLVTINGVEGDRKIAGNYNSVTLVTDGTSWTLIDNGYNGSDDVTPGNVTTGSVDLNTSVSYFSTVANETASLGTGREGQTKALVMQGSNGTMTVTVGLAGWKVGGGSGTIVFDQVGDACVLQFMQGKWYVVSNNNCQIDSYPAEVVPAPSTQNASGKEGQIAFDSSFLYVCIATNNWKSVPFTSTFKGNFNEGTSNLDSLSDVVITGPISGQVLKWNGTTWTNAADE